MMALRHRLTLLAAGTVGVTVVLVSIVAYVALRSELRGQVDDALARSTRRSRACAARADRARRGHDFPPPPLRAAARRGPVQVIDARRRVIFRTPGARPLRPGRRGRPRRRRRRGRRALLRDTQRRRRAPARADGRARRRRRDPVRAQPRQRRRDALAPAARAHPAVRRRHAAGGVVRAAVRPPGHPARHRADRGRRAHHADRGPRPPHRGARRRRGRPDGARFNTMLDTLEGSRRALDDSVHAQRQLVADASHELRTPVTSLRTNIEVLLAEGGELPDDDRTPAARGRPRRDRGAERADHRRHRARARRRAAAGRRGGAARRRSSPRPSRARGAGGRA